MLSNLLRYGTRHHLFFPRGGERPKLNPTCSYSHVRGSGTLRTWSSYEPLWVFLARQKLFCQTNEIHRCGKREDSPAGFMRETGVDKALPDTWRKYPNGDRCCSYCGSLHPDDFMKLCTRALTDPAVSIDGTDKSYKVYVRQPGVVNASQGGIKFYMQHTPEQPTTKDQETFKAASRISAERTRARFEKGVAAA